ncbi:MAG: bifunctional riboflavin kinase/FAD synthetase [Chloroflexi bacterium]|nr:bifunctional riboflavin kinase/FAD synthetase [Chloroflexota bacterium]MCL5075421.1 bifunctional riboflavin kinase/FAD synthetase [Chloroflexota bacterium]
MLDLLGMSSNDKAVVTIGVMDGVHLGHQYLLGQVVSRARKLDCSSAVITFDPHPQIVLMPETHQGYLTSLEERITLIKEQGIDIVAVLRFDKEVAKMSAQRFVRLVCQHIHMVELWVGPDFALGYKRRGTVAALSRIGSRAGFTVCTVPPLLVKGEVVSSTQIRQLVASGDVVGAAKLLGRPPSIIGQVGVGMKRGQTIGYATANLSVSGDRLIPAEGVYAARTLLNEQQYAAVVNIGTRPTFGERDRTVEVHLLDFSGDIYGQTLKVEFIERLRDEIRFANADLLAGQIQFDVARARGLLGRRETQSTRWT